MKERMSNGVVLNLATMPIEELAGVVETYASQAEDARIDYQIAQDYYSRRLGGVVLNDNLAADIYE